MRRLALAVLITLSLAPAAARALTPKCGDDPYEDRKGEIGPRNGLWISWVVPLAPGKGAPAVVADAAFPDVDAAGVEEAYQQALAAIGAANPPKACHAARAPRAGTSKLASSAAALRSWEWSRLDIPPVPQATPILQAYEAEARRFFAMPVEHPKLEPGEDRREFKWASPVLTHAVVILDPASGAETVYLRSRLLSRSEGHAKQRCIRTPALRFEDAAKGGRIWLGGRFAALSGEKAGVLVVHVLTAGAVTLSPGAAMEVKELPPFTFGKQAYQVRRAVLRFGAPDPAHAAEHAIGYAAVSAK